VVKPWSGGLRLRRVRVLALALAIAGALPGCSDPAVEVHLSQKNAHVEGSSLAVRVSDHYNGEQLTVEEIEIEVEDDAGDFRPVTVALHDGDTSAVEVALVADNSGSQKSVEETIRLAARAFSERILSMGDSAQVGLIRVSTQSEVVAEMSDDAAELNRSIENGLRVSNGWSALYDGVRLANEVLDRGYDPAEGTPCATPVFRGIVVFTNGEDNNSADQHKTSRRGDGIDTSLDMLKQLDVHGTLTPIFAVGVGKGVDEKMLSELADDTGGLYSAITSYRKLETALEKAAYNIWNAKLVCLPATDSMGKGANPQRVRVKVKAHTKLGVATQTADLDF